MTYIHDFFNDDLFDENEPYDFPISYEQFVWDIQNSVYGQDEAISDIAYDIYQYISGSFSGKCIKHNIMISGPSASGKTELYRTVKKILKQYNCPIPVLHVDISGFSPAGFVGTGLSSIPERIAAQGSLGYAIVFLDEFDKILLPLSSSGNENFHSALQHEMLSLLEGKECQSSTKPNLAKMVDTNKTLFIGMGAFTDFRKQKMTPEKTLGFSATTSQSLEFYDMSMRDLVSVGGAVELVGRFDSLYNFHVIDDKAFQGLYLKTLEELGKEQDILLKSTKEACVQFAILAKSEFGCREMKRMLYQTIRPCLKEIANCDDRIMRYILIREVGKAELRRKKETVDKSIHLVR